MATKDPIKSLKPVLSPQHIPISVVEVETGEIIVCRTDATGEEIQGSEFTTTQAMWDKSWSKSTVHTFKIKKK